MRWSRGMAFGCAPIVLSTRVAQDSAGEDTGVGISFLLSVIEVGIACSACLGGSCIAPLLSG
jgi:predicted MFS family arabinose efflux permease